MRTRLKRIVIIIIINVSRERSAEKNTKNPTSDTLIT